MVDQINGEYWSKGKKDDDTVERWDLGTGLVGEVIDSGNVVNLDDAYKEPKFNKVDDLKNHYRTKALLIVPVSN